MNIVNIKVCVIGTGLCAKAFKNGYLKSGGELNDLAFVQVRRTRAEHYSSVLRRGGMAGYWHKGFMSPGLAFLRTLGLSASEINIVDEQLDLPDYFHENVCNSTYRMHISAKGRQEFIVSKNIINLCSIDGIVKKDEGWEIRSSSHLIKAEKLVLAASTVGNLNLLNMLGYFQELDSEKPKIVFFNDHVMSIKHSYNELGCTDPLWHDDKLGLHQTRYSFFSSSLLKLSSRVGLLAFPLIGKGLYGLLSPLYALDVLFRKMFKAKKAYVFDLLTPEKPIARFSDDAVVVDGSYTLAFHPVGCSDKQILDKVEGDGITVLSGLVLPLDFKYFPSYTLYAYSYSRGKNL